MSPVGFKPAIPANERPQTHALDRARLLYLYQFLYETQNLKYMYKLKD
jgi:hypothetical protein